MYNNKNQYKPGKWISKLYKEFISFQKNNIQLNGIGFGQIPIIMGLSLQKDISQNDLAKSIHIDRTTLNRTIRPLIDNGYICCTPNPNDKRANCVNLTEKGIEILPEIRNKLDIWNMTILKGFSKEEQTQFSKLLQRASNNVVSFNNKGNKSE